MDITDTVTAVTGATTNMGTLGLAVLGVFVFVFGFRQLRKMIAG